jgi:tetratricopeptide (TPR) repeat protein
MKKWIFLLAAFLVVITNAFADDALDPAVVQLQHDWAKANYHTARDQQEAAFRALTEKAHQISASSQDKAEAMIWEAIMLSGYARAKGGLGALKFAEQSRDLLLASIKINPQALQGSAHTSLGSLYYKVPGWPIGFGDHKKAREHLERALQINPTGIDPNYFYADFLLEEGEADKAIEYFNKALNAPPRPGREDADEGRRADIAAGKDVKLSGLAISRPFI